MTGNASTAAQRLRRHRERKWNGVLFMAHVPIYPLDAEALVKRGRLRPEDEGNREKIAEAVELLVDHLTEGRLEGSARYFWVRVQTPSQSSSGSFLA